MQFETVHTFYRFSDCPRSGIADFSGKPHFFEWRFDEKLDDYGKTCTLRPVAKEIFQTALEDWAMWQRWKSASKNGTVAIGAPWKDHHPVLPQDEARFRDIAPEVAKIKGFDNRAPSFTAIGNFRRIAGADPNDVDGPWEVSWERC